MIGSTNIKQDYFQWLCEMVHSDGPSQSYGILLKTLHSIPFFATHERDLNRMDDGFRLRYEYEYICPSYIPESKKEEFFEEKVSVLEVLIALANRIEDLMYDPNKGDQTLIWFWEMISNLGFENFTDEAFGCREWYSFQVEDIIKKWLERKFQRSGKGSPFPLKYWKYDQRKLELLYQMNDYLNERYPI